MKKETIIEMVMTVKMTMIIITIKKQKGWPNDSFDRLL